MSSTADGQVNGRAMNAVSDIASATSFARVLEDAEAAKLGIRVTKARSHVARRLGASPGTLENLRRGRLKIVPNWLMARIRSEFVAVLQNEVRRLEHEISIARQAGLCHRDDVLAKAETQLGEARKILSSAGT